MLAAAPTPGAELAGAGWPAARPLPVVGDGTVHVWRVDCSPSPAASRRARRLLDEDELARAARLRRVDDAARLLLAHAAVRLLLGAALGGDPRALRFVRRCGECGAPGHGKPYLDGRSEVGELDFSLSHTGEVALVAVARGRRIGVDVESVARAGDPMLGAEFLSPGEQQEIASLAPVERPRAAALAWTRKEAFLKGHGRGITGDLRTLHMQPSCRGAITCNGLASPSSVAAPGAASGGARPQPWQIRTFEPWPGYVAALAGEGVWHVRGWTLDPSALHG